VTNQNPGYPVAVDMSVWITYVCYSVWSLQI